MSRFHSLRNGIARGIAAGVAIPFSKGNPDQTRARFLALRLLAESPDDFPELPLNAVLVITPKIRKQARDFLAYRQRAEPMDQGMPGC